MSNASGTPRTSAAGAAGTAGTGRAPAPRAASDPAAPKPAGAPEPEPLRFFGTSWVDHDGGYAARRLGLAAGALVAAAAGALVLRLAYQGLTAGEPDSLVNLLVVVAFAMCSAVSFRRTWTGFASAPDATAQTSMRGFTAIGFLGVLLAYAARCLVEAPGERLLRTRYETAREEHERRTARRTGNPAARRKKRKG
ncbi:membrane protein [Streptomyces sulfonofaciens]|uniref:Membrane protein n=1 Tax=Streptomyces sulfonofaciens TaxID=68272 RepID=A0A919L7H5_9ACTN|nr:EamA/RhaT family transporter [Streptomyces sulfonofaciens]GHH85511.1 membrane protein [Streptomyces sulfonofaciens]